MKLFISVVLILCISLSIFGYLLIIKSFRDAIKRELPQALEQFQLIKFSIQLNSPTLISGNEIALSNVLDNVVSSNLYTDLIAIYSSKNQKINSTFP